MRLFLVSALLVVALLARGAPVSAADDVAVIFPAVPGIARVDVGTISAGGAMTARGAVARQRVPVRLVRSSSAPGSARLYVALAQDPGALRVKVDGVQLSTAPQLVDASAPLGMTVVRIVEIEVPATEPPGPISLPMTWIAEAS